MSKRLYRLPEQGQITGVAAGLADYFRIDSTVVRVLFVVGTFLTDGFVALAYLVLAVVLPVKGRTSADFSERVRTLTASMSEARVRNWLGIGLIVLGGWYLLSAVWPRLVDFDWMSIGPVILIAVGIIILVRGRR